MRRFFVSITFAKQAAERCDGASVEHNIEYSMRNRAQMAVQTVAAAARKFGLQLFL